MRNPSAPRRHITAASALALLSGVIALAVAPAAAFAASDLTTTVTAATPSPVAASNTTVTSTIRVTTISGADASNVVVTADPAAPGTTETLVADSGAENFTCSGATCTAPTLFFSNLHRAFFDLITTITPLTPGEVTTNSFTLTSTDAGSTSASAAGATVIVHSSTTTTVTSDTNPALLNQSVTFTANIDPTGGSGNPSGTVNFTADGTTIPGCGAQPIDPLPRPNPATCTTSFSTVGNPSIVAIYSGGASSSAFHYFDGSTSPALTEVVTSGADLSLAKSAAPTTPPGCSAAQALADSAPAPTTTPCVLHGQDVTYTLTDSNNLGGITAAAPTITDTLPIGQGFVRSDDPSCTTSGTPTTGVTVTCPTADLPSGSNITITIEASTTGVPQQTTYLAQTNSASVASATFDPNTANNSASAVIDVIAAADLSLVKTASPNPVVAGQQLTYTVTVTNSGPDSATAPVITDVLPTGVTLETEGVVEVVRNKIGGSVDIANNAGTVPTPNTGRAVCSGTATITCTLADLASGASARVTFLVVPGAGSPPNTASVSSSTPDPNLANNQDTVTTTVDSNCTLNKTGHTSSAIIVPAGELLCLSNATVDGAIVVHAGGGLTVTNSTTAAITAAPGSAFVTVCGSTVKGSIDVTGSPGLVDIGNTGPVACGPNKISGAVVLTSNHGGAGGPAIVGNQIAGALDCQNDHPVATDDGVTNQTIGAKLRECSGPAF